MANTKTDRTLNPAEAGLFLRDVFVVSSSSTRYALPEAAPKGKLFTSLGLEMRVEERRGKKGLLGTITTALKGQQVIDGSTDEAPAFSAKVILEGFFETEGHEILKEEDITKNIADMAMTHLMPIASIKVREMTFDMGYSSIRQPLGFSPTRFEVDKLLEPKKRTKRKPKASTTEEG